MTATVSDLELSLPLISQDDKDELAVRDNRDIKIDRQYSILAEQLIARQVWLEMVVGSNNPGILMPTRNNNGAPRLGNSGVELMTPDWKSRNNKVNRDLTTEVESRMRQIPVSVFSTSP